MTNYVSHTELDQAIQVVVEDIRETEARLRGEFSSAVLVLERHLDKQDTRLDQVLLALLAGLFLILTAVIYLVK